MSVDNVTAGQGQGGGGSAGNESGGDGSGGRGFGWPPGELTDELQKLVVAVQDWAGRTVPEHFCGHPNSDTESCAICQLSAVARGERPDVLEKVAAAGMALAVAARALLTDPVAASQSGAPEPDSSGQSAAQPTPPPGRPMPPRLGSRLTATAPHPPVPKGRSVQHIDLGPERSGAAG